MLEKDVEKAICKFAKDQGITVLKLGGMNDRGKSDRMFMRSGKAVFLEIKAPGKKPTALQERFLNQRKTDGFKAHWVDNVDDGIMWLEDVFNL